MKINFTGRHVGVDGKEREYALGKIEALARFHRHIEDVEVRVSMDGNVLEKVELDAGLGHHLRAAAMAEADNFRKAFDGALAGLRRQIQKDKSKQTDRRRTGVNAKRTSSRGVGMENGEGS